MNAREATVALGEIVALAELFLEGNLPGDPAWCRGVADDVARWDEAHTRYLVEPDSLTPSLLAQAPSQLAAYRQRVEAWPSARQQAREEHARREAVRREIVEERGVWCVTPACWDERPESSWDIVWRHGCAMCYDCADADSEHRNELAAAQYEGQNNLVRGER